MSEEREFADIVERTGLNETELAAVAGCSVPTARLALAAKRFPPRSGAVFSNFVKRYKRARTRADFRLPKRTTVRSQASV